MGVAVITGQAIANRSGVTLLARIVGQNGQPITQASLSKIQYALTDFGAGVRASTPGPPNPAPTTGLLRTVTISTTVFDALQQNDPRWTKDSAANLGVDGLWGWNFLFTIPLIESDGIAMLTSGNRQQCTVVFTPVTGQSFRALFQWSMVESFV
jgi:hypothetical protein